MVRLAAAALCAAAIILPSIARADAYGDLQTMRTAFNAATSWHAVEQMADNRTVTVDYSAPDRWRIVNPAMTTIVIGGSMYMVRDGKATAMPPFMSGMIQKSLSGIRFGSYSADVKSSARDLGMRTVNGKSLHAYGYTTNGIPVTIYVGADHLPVESIVQTKGGTTTITYSGFNAPITIAAP